MLTYTTLPTARDAWIMVLLATIVFAVTVVRSLAKNDVALVPTKAFTVDPVPTSWSAATRMTVHAKGTSSIGTEPTTGDPMVALKVPILEIPSNPVGP